MLLLCKRQLEHKLLGIEYASLPVTGENIYVYIYIFFFFERRAFFKHAIKS